LTGFGHLVYKGIMQRIDVKDFLKKYGVGYSALAREAGVGHTSIKRWLENPKAGISTLTVDKLQAAMLRIEKKLNQTA